MPKLGLSGGRPRPRHKNGVLPAYAATPAKKHYVSLLKKRREVRSLTIKSLRIENRQKKASEIIMYSGNKIPTLYSMYPKNEGVLNPAWSAIAFTIKLGPLPM